eukprot:PITA_18853
MLHSIVIPEWKWEVISMGFITSLLRIVRQHDSIMVVVDKLTKAAHFIQVKSTFSTRNVARMFIIDVVRLHGVPKNIVSDKDAKFTSKFWKELFAVVEFSYNNGYQESLRMNLFKALYGWSFNTPINWSDPVNRVFIGPDMLVDMEQEMQVIKKNLKETRDRQKIYAD